MNAEIACGESGMRNELEVAMGIYYGQCVFIRLSYFGQEIPISHFDLATDLSWSVHNVYG